jgi:hypothetical protein
MIARLRKVEGTAANEPLALELSSRKAPMITEYADRRLLRQQPDRTDRRLRNWLIAANVVAWIAIITLIRLIFF